MSIQETYLTISAPGQAEYKDRGSRFIAYLFPVSDTAAGKMQLNAVKKEHPSATHHCFAWRIGFSGEEFRSSDAGEPSGTAGKPILNQLISHDVTNAMIIVVRYFGGSLLGVPGLIQAYKTAASLVLQTTQIIQRSIENYYLLEFDYTLMNEVMILVKQYQCTVLQQEMQLFCRMKIGVPLRRKEEVLNRIKEIQGVQFSLAGP